MPESVMPDNDLLMFFEEDLTPEQKVRAAKDQRENLEVFVGDERTFVIVVAVHKDSNRNIVKKISCKKGVYIGGYLFDEQSDSYTYHCSEYLNLGYVPISMFVKLRGQSSTSSWQMRVPLSESVIKKFLTPLQKKELKFFRSQFKQEEYLIEFVQIVDPN
jgi:hypothetical protein